jgi:alpha-1,3-mannosyltransferase
VQLLLAVPFLYTSPLNYLLGAFNLGRVFLFQWTVNFRYKDPGPLGH